MSQSFGKATPKELNMMEDKYGKKDRAQESKKKDLEKNESKVGTYGGSSARAFVTGKKYVIKMKYLKNKLVQTHDSDSDVDGDWVTLIKSGGWSGDQA